MRPLIAKPLPVNDEKLSLKIGEIQNMIKNPQSSLIARVFHILSLSFTFLSIIQFCIETMKETAPAKPIFK